MSLSWQLSRKKSLHHICYCCCCCCCNCRYPPGNKYLVVLFIFLFGIIFLVVVFPFHIYLFVLVYLFSVLFPPPPTATKAYEAASIQIPTPIPIPIPIPLTPLLNNDVRTSQYFILWKPLQLLRGNNLPTHELLTTSLPAYIIWCNWLQQLLRWGQKWFPRVFNFLVLYLIPPTGGSLRENSWDSWGISFPLLPTPPPLKKIRIMMKTTDSVGGETVGVASRRGKG